MIYKDKISEAVEFLKTKLPKKPQIAMVLGSGLGGFAKEIPSAIDIPYEDIPFWPKSTVPGHAGQLVCGQMGNNYVMTLNGRVHYYEGYSMDEVTFPIRVCGLLGVKTLILTNASGGINYGLTPGDLVLIYDHINFMGVNPLRSEEGNLFEPRFPDMTFAYDHKLMVLCEQVAEENGITLKRGIYIAFSGPSFETPAEIRMARILGADIVGMSTVPEAMAAKQMGIRVCAISCVANYAAGMEDKPLTHEEVLEETKKASSKLAIILRSLCDTVKES
ncbi:MAG: purine-nucleoside phosphorylase [Acetomicrobium sp.]|jgi:purine-nucleoside phosphorylase|nr:purine-nucleoside phosphorylase [Acetomicrobium sp.]HPT64419.1 purine-nucleoside phosphorylase [Acetomicrobium sp.]HXK98568.1 purine-nucleoside phosphorylase [Acetomicrobium sp.]